MDTLYLVSLLIGSFFIMLSLMGGGDAEVDVDGGVEFDADPGTDLLPLAEGEPGGSSGSGPGLVDLFSVRALFLFAAFFGLTGTLLSWAGSGEVFTPIASLLMGLVVGLGGNYVIKSIGYQHVSSDISLRDLRGMTGRVMIPFEGQGKGKIAIVARGNRLQIVARSFGEGPGEVFARGDEVVVVGVEGSTVQVVKPE
jgi:membrane-bound ClpP family serine protease